MGIQLKNIDLTGYTLEEEKAKLLEEINELIKITVDIDTNNSFEHFSEETFDILQVCVGIAEKKYKKSADDLMKESWENPKAKKKPKKCSTSSPAEPTVYSLV